MSEKDYNNFLIKIEQLNKLVELIETSPDKYNLIVNCKTHDEVVELAKDWGFNIGKRWGEY
tara:strand:- start:6 stop:188 length:183 start_codon:yes stop_codon:yes gene_type:complete